jgi:hypothetical protein
MKMKTMITTFLCATLLAGVAAMADDVPTVPQAGSPSAEVKEQLKQDKAAVRSDRKQLRKDRVKLMKDRKDAGLPVKGRKHNHKKAKSEQPAAQPTAPSTPSTN